MSDFAGLVALGAALAALFFSGRAGAASSSAGYVTTSDDQAYTVNRDDPIYPGDAFLIGDFWQYPVYTPNVQQPAAVVDNPYLFDPMNSIIDVSNVLYDPYGFNYLDYSLLPIDNLPSYTGDDMPISVYQRPTGISLQGLETLKTREGFSSIPYWDKKGYSIGFGHLMSPGETYESISVEKATELLFEDVREAENEINARVQVDLTQNQYDALVSFVYNVGIGAFRNSTMLRKLNAGDASAVDEFDRWIYSRDDTGAKEVNNVLVGRRSDEKAQFSQA